ncbi:MAG: hypothetical protein JW910_22110 [Anaerolineae bacterium]|nr:hypothetical protein [Anaerolineae bacterium]
MARIRNARWLLIIGGVLLLVIVGGVAGFVIGAQEPIPFAVLSHYSADLLLEEARTMNECAECHAAEDFHECTTCHDDHGAVEFEGVPFFAMIAFTGDVPEPGFVPLNDILPYRDQPYTHLPLLDFLAAQGVTDFAQVVLASNDGGFITLEPGNLNEGALLLPYTDGIRFAAEDLHVSTWLKGITRVIVIGTETPLLIDGEATSIGRLLLGPTRAVTVEQTEVMLISENDGEMRSALTASRIEGAPLAEILANPAFETLTVIDAIGESHTLTAEEADGALLIAERDGVTLVLPERGRSRWIEQVVEVTSE